MTVKTKSSGIKAWPESERPRERILKHGATALSDAELLAVLLRNGRSGEDAISMARRILAKFGSLRKLMSASADDLCGVSGVGPAKATQIIAACELAVRRSNEKAVGVDMVKSPQSVYEIVSETLRDSKNEVFTAILLNKKNELIEIRQIAHGTPDKVAIYPRQVVEMCLSTGASKLILAHNHPSGSTDPSTKDIQLTAKLYEGLKFVDIELLDHIIVGKDGFNSMKRGGYFQEMIS